MSETVTDQDIQDLIDSGGELPSYHSILEVWREILKPAKKESTEPVLAGFAHKITSSYREINFADMNDYRDRYFAKILRFAEILDEEIATDEECLKQTTPEEDVEHNAQHYRNLLLNWQLQLVDWEKAWDCTADWAPTELAAISEAHKMFFGDTGLTAFLDNISFPYTEQDQAELATALQARRDERE